MEFDLRSASQQFQRDGFLLIPSALSAGEYRTLAAEIDEARAAHPLPGMTRWFGTQLHCRSLLFAGLLDRSPAVDLAEHLLAFERGDWIDREPPELRHSCHVINTTAIVAGPGDQGQHWHVDDYILMPRPPGVPWDDRIPYPVYVLTAMYYLVDVDRELGATKVVPGSHKSGRRPEPHDPAPSYEGREAVTFEVRAGDCLIFHHQLWHFALPNETTASRYLLQVHYGARFVAPRMFPFPNHHIPPSILEKLTPRQQRLMGLHPCYAPYC
jgi:hypothetical protein